MTSNIKKEVALSMIKNYRAGIAPDALKSVWLDNSIIDFIVQNANAHEHDKIKISGIRAYLALDDKKQQTIILALTTFDGKIHKDIDAAIYDYGQACPPICGMGDLSM